MCTARWLALLAPLGLLGYILKQPLFYPLLGLALFVPLLFCCDERAQAVFKAAATAAFTVSLVAFAGAFAYLGLLAGVGAGPRSLDGATAFVALFLAYAAGVVAHMVGSLYLRYLAEV